MTIQEIATRLHELVKVGDSDTAYKELFSDNATSTELNMMIGERDTKQGMDAIKKHEAHFKEMLEEMHGGYTNEPTTFGNNIFMEMGMDAKMKGMERMYMKEMAHYVVADGKIISQEFFY